MLKDGEFLKIRLHEDKIHITLIKESFDCSRTYQGSLPLDKIEHQIKVITDPKELQEVQRRQIDVFEQTLLKMAGSIDFSNKYGSAFPNIKKI